MNLNKILVVDASYMMHRQLHVDSIFNLTNAEGKRTGGIFNFMRSLNLEMRKHPGYYPILVWDQGLDKRRLKVHPNYKHHEERQLLNEQVKKGLQEADEERDEYLYEYSTQRGDVMDLGNELGIPSIRVPDWEGDDLMKICTMMSDDSIILTDDKDLIQMLSPTTQISRPLAGQELKYDEWQAEHNDPGMRKFIIAKSIVGDPSDNIPKCAKGVGGKTADKFAEIMVEHPTDWIETISAGTRKAWKAFVEPDSLDRFRINMELIDLSRVDVTDEIQSIVANAITNGLHVPSYMGALKYISKFQMEKFDIDSMVSQLTMMCSNVITE